MTEIREQIQETSKRIKRLGESSQEIGEIVELEEAISSDYLAEFAEITPDSAQLKASGLLVDGGFFEISTNSLTKPSYVEKVSFLNEKENVTILNKLSEDLGVLRQSLLFTGLEVIAHNINRKQNNLRLFEFGAVYKKLASKKYKEKNCLSLWLTGQNHSESWIEKNKTVEFHDLSAIVLKLIQKFSPDSYISKVLSDEVFNYGLEIIQKNRHVAKFGLLNKNVTKMLSIDQDVFYAEVDFDGLLSEAKTGFSVSEISKFPEVRRDLSLVLDKSVTFEQIKEIATGKEFGVLLQDINVFDYYVGEKIEKDKKAYALSFILQDKTKTLTDKVIDGVMSRLMKKFESNLGAVIRQ